MNAFGKETKQQKQEQLVKDREARKRRDERLAKEKERAQDAEFRKKVQAELLANQIKEACEEWNATPDCDKHYNIFDLYYYETKNENGHPQFRIGYQKLGEFRDCTTNEKLSVVPFVKCFTTELDIDLDDMHLYVSLKPPTMTILQYGKEPLKLGWPVFPNIKSYEDKYNQMEKQMEEFFYYKNGSGECVYSGELSHEYRDEPIFRTNEITGNSKYPYNRPCLCVPLEEIKKQEEEINDYLTEQCKKIDKAEIIKKERKEKNAELALKVI